MGIKGAVWATLAIILPSLVIISALAGILTVVSDNKIVAHAFEGIRIVVIALIFNEVVKIFKKAVASKYQFGLFIFVLMLIFGMHTSSTAIVFLTAGIGLIKGLLQK